MSDDIIIVKEITTDDIESSKELSEKGFDYLSNVLDIHKPKDIIIILGNIILLYETKIKCNLNDGISKYVSDIKEIASGIDFKCQCTKCKKKSDE